MKPRPIFDLLLPRCLRPGRRPHKTSTILPLDPLEQQLLDRQRAARGIRDKLDQQKDMT